MSAENIIEQFNKLCEKFSSNTKIYIIRYPFNEVHEDPWRIDGEYRYFMNSDDAVNFKTKHEGTIILPYTISDLIKILKTNVKE